MIEPEFADVLGPALAGALEKKGFTSLTQVQKTVLDPSLAGRDLRITSQTGSGKTVAIGLAIRDLFTGDLTSRESVARPRALVVAPTRELAKQVEEELAWLYAPLRAKVASATGGGSVRDERRALAAGPAIVVGTPGRMLDHLNRGAIDPSQVGAVVLDEADRLLDLGFRDELEAILAHAPEGHRTHLVSATFPREVRALADRVQGDPAHVEGTRLGEANLDIDHVLHLVDARDRLSAMVNLLLANPEEQQLIFARTRADVAEIAQALSDAGFAADSLSGEMEQAARNRAMSAFKRGDLRVLVATDVAARGIDVQDIARVLHADPPGDPDAYTHRSGRTGRAGRKGVSSVLVPPSILGRVTRLLQRAGVAFRFETIPTAASIREGADERLFESLTADDPEGAPPLDGRMLALAERLAAADNLPRTIARLLVRMRQATGAEPREVRHIQPPGDMKRPSRRNPAGTDEAYGAQDGPRPRREAYRPSFDSPRPQRDDGGPQHDSQRPPRDDNRPQFDSQRPPRDENRNWALFQVSWGEVHGADVRRMLAMACRRGGIGSNDIGAIRIGHVASTVEVAPEVAEAFAEATAKPDVRDPRIVIRPVTGGPPPRARDRALRTSRTKEHGPDRADDGFEPRPEPPAEPRPEAAERTETPRTPRAETAERTETPRTPRAAAATRPHASPRARAEHTHADEPPAPPARQARAHADEPPAPPARQARAHSDEPPAPPARKPHAHAEARLVRPKSKVAAAPARSFAKSKGWVKKPAAAPAASAGDAPPKRRRIVG